MKSVGVIAVLVALSACESEVARRSVGAGVVTTRHHGAATSRGYDIDRYSVHGHSWDHVNNVVANARGDVFMVQRTDTPPARAFTVDAAGNEHAFPESPYAPETWLRERPVEWCGNDVVIYQYEGTLKAVTPADGAMFTIDPGPPGRQHLHAACTDAGDLVFTVLTRPEHPGESSADAEAATDGVLDLCKWNVRDGVKCVATWPEEKATVANLTDVAPCWQEGAPTWCRMPRPYPCTFDTPLSTCAQCIRP